MKTKAIGLFHASLITASLAASGCVGAPVDEADGETGRDQAVADEEAALLAGGARRATIKNTQTGRCLEYKSLGNQGKGEVVAAPCDGSFEQSWLLVERPNNPISGGRMVHLRNSGHCIDHKFTAGSSPDAPVCNGTFGETFSDNVQEWQMTSTGCRKSPNVHRFVTLGGGTAQWLSNRKTASTDPVGKVSYEANPAGCTVDGEAIDRLSWTVTYR